jgi:exodeoxyribonuclease VIII
MTLEDLKSRPLSYSSLKEFAKSPIHYINYLTKERKDSPELIFGSALHCILLTPDLFNDQFVISRKFDLRKSADKDEYAALLVDATDNNKKIIQDDMHTDLINLTNLVKDNKEFADIINNATSICIETKQYKELFGIPFVYIKDIETSDMTIDIKTVQNGSIEALNKDFFNYDYPLQAAIYGGNFHFYVVEKNPPFYNGLISVDKRWIDYGLNKLEKLCVAFNY